VTSSIAQRNDAAGLVTRSRNARRWNGAADRGRQRAYSGAQIIKSRACLTSRYRLNPTSGARERGADLWPMTTAPEHRDDFLACLPEPSLLGQFRQLDSAGTGRGVPFP